MDAYSEKWRRLIFMLTPVRRSLRHARRARIFYLKIRGITLDNSPIFLHNK
ncbi:hypothetical protein B4098_2943 [Heyndrickxia coagulans]|uniref:Uncharacterized protein n=1 Tax=Heyndrickxia coagulans TaxID=1398 RepID=A0A150JSG0_HEYCO|nr:hypothetical protein B4098_2943 [Heyndrickxia coagulans]